MASVNFPIWHSIRVAYTDTFQNLGKVVKLAGIPFLLAFLARFLIDLAGVISPINSLGHFPVNGPLAIPILLTSSIIGDGCLAVFALAMFRYQLLGWSEGTDHVRLELGKREFVFLGAALLAQAIHMGLWSCFIAMGTLASTDPYYLGNELLSLAVDLVKLGVFARLCFVLAEVSTDVAISPRLGVRDWARLVVVLALTIGPFEILRSIPTYLSYSNLSHLSVVFYPALPLLGVDAALLLSAFVEHAIFLALAFLGIAVAVTAVSAAYRVRTLPQPQGL